MAELRRVQSVLAVRDLGKSVAFYREKLGFTVDFEIEGWAWMSRGPFRLMLGQLPRRSAGESRPTTTPSSLMCSAAASTTCTVSSESEHGYAIGAIADKPWGESSWPRGLMATESFWPRTQEADAQGRGMITE